MANNPLFVSERVIPAIMPQSFEHLETEMRRFVSFVPFVQIDVMDGKFTDSKSWPYKNGVDMEFVKIVNQEEGFPFWEDLNVEVDLMVSDPMGAADQWIAAGATRIVVHYESAAPTVIVTILQSIKDKGIEGVLAVGLQTQIKSVALFYDENKDIIDGVQFMGIDKIGFQGEPFNEVVIENIGKFKEKFPESIVSVDGGVNLDTAPSLNNAGVDRLVAGSVLSTGSIEDTLLQLDPIIE